MPRFEEQQIFLKKNYREFTPVTNDRELLDLLEETSNVKDISVDEERVTKSIEQLETKMYLLEKEASECDPNAKRVLISAAEPLAYLTIAPIIEHLKTDQRCRSVGLLTDNIAGKRFEESGDQRF